jgi:uncharacterized RDD family membrane protein YckC
MADPDSAANPPEAAIGYGGFWVRLAAALVDGVLLVTVTALMGVLMREDLHAGTAASLMGLVYEVGMVASAYQATVGKLAFRLRVVDREGRRLSVLRSFCRVLAKFLSWFVLGLGYLMIAITARKRGLHDFICGTLVVRLPDRRQPTVVLPQV